MTKQRRAILDELRRERHHPTASELYSRLRNRLPRISLGTVYRNLAVLSREGVVRRIESPGEETRFDGSDEEHDHIRCVSCGRVDDVLGTPAALDEGRLPELAGYEVLGHRLEFFGVCPECRDKPAAGQDTVE